MILRAAEPHWLDQYGNLNQYRWQTLEQCGRMIYYRPLGLVEYSFDADGRYFEGRADMNAQIDVEVRSSLSNEDFRERILMAWTCLRCKHLLLQAKALPTRRLYGYDAIAGSDVCFAVEAPRTVIQAIEDAGQHLVFLSDHYDYVDPRDFWLHCQNVARVVDPDRALSRLFVYGLERRGDGRSILRFLKVAAHQIEDGLTTYVWMRDFVALLNEPISELRKQLRGFLEPDCLFKRLPLPQEALYPPVPGNKARQRWFWLLTRILRHVRRPLQSGFVNPLRRRHPRGQAVHLSPTYSRLLDYSKTPLLNAIPMFAKASTKSTQRLHRLCKEVGSTIGAGSFALAALIMFEFYESREPDIPLAERRPFITGFPLNPRAFYNYRIEPNSLMLAFSDGISLPFLPSDLDVEGRLKLLIRQAHRQLAAYQKRVNPKVDNSGLEYMGSRGAGRMLATQYLWSTERMEARRPERLRTGINPQGGYPMRPNISGQTCGVSSVGRRQNMIEQGVYSLDDVSKDFIADYRNIYAAVRPRDDEFLVGTGGSEDGLWVDASIDGNAMDPALVEAWRIRFETVLDEDCNSRPSKL